MLERQNAPKLAYSINEACTALSLGRTTIYALIRADRLQVIRVCGRTLIPTASLNNLVSDSVNVQNTCN
mgnify:CR=1|jgi:excisionase family DNA binding protein